MPILWRYLLSQYLRVLVLSVVAMIAILMISRLDEVAEFAVLGPQAWFVLKYALFQIPYIIPIALPVGCLISSVLLYQRLSRTHEIIALRAAGMPMRQIVAPVLIAGIYLSLADLYLVSELATRCHLATRRMEHEARTWNPMVLLQNRQFLRHKGIYCDVLGEHRTNEEASDILLAASNRSLDRTNLVLIKKLAGDGTYLSTEQTSFIYSMPAEEEDSYDHLVIENMEKTLTPFDGFSQHMKRDGWRLSRDHLDTSLLLVRLGQDRLQYKQAVANGAPLTEQRHLEGRLNRCYTELVRRVTISLAVFAFTFMGVAFGIDLSRSGSKKGVLAVIALAALYLTCFFMGKARENQLWMACALYTLPLVLIISLSLRNLKRISAGTGT